MFKQQRKNHHKHSKTAKKPGKQNRPSTITRFKGKHSIISSQRTLATLNRSPREIFFSPPQIRTQQLPLSVDFFIAVAIDKKPPHLETQSRKQHKTTQNQSPQITSSTYFPYPNPQQLNSTYSHRSLHYPPLDVASNSTTFPTLLDFENYLSTITISVKRLDEIHPQISGNKWYKLLYNLSPYLPTQTISTSLDQQTITSHNSREVFDKPLILTFGGAFSNHIAATSVASKLSNFPGSIGIIRGEELSIKPLNQTLTCASCDNGMDLIYMDRHTYRLRNHPKFNQQLVKQLKNLQHFYIIEQSNDNDVNTTPRQISFEFDMGTNNGEKMIKMVKLPSNDNNIKHLRLVQKIAQGHVQLDPDHHDEDNSDSIDQETGLTDNQDGNDDNKTPFFIPLFFRQDHDYSHLINSLKIKTMSNYLDVGRCSDDTNTEYPSGTGFQESNFSKDEKLTQEILLIPEGGTNSKALLGTSEIISQDEMLEYTHITTAVGTGGTLGGLVLKKLQILNNEQQTRPQIDSINLGSVKLEGSSCIDNVNDHNSKRIALLYGFSAVSPQDSNLEQLDSYLSALAPNPFLKAAATTKESESDLSNLIDSIGENSGSHQSQPPLKTTPDNRINHNSNPLDYQIIPTYLGKGYALASPPLLRFIDHFESTFQIPIDQVYTGKMIYGVFDMIYHGVFPPGSNILILHTGGLQGKSKM